MSVLEDRGRFLNTCCHNGPVVFCGIVLISIPVYSFIRSAVIDLFNGGNASFSSPILDTFFWAFWHLFPFLLFMSTFIAICLFVRWLQSAQSDRQGTGRGPAAGFITAVGSPEPYARMYGSLYTSVPQAVQPEDSRPLGSSTLCQTAPTLNIGPPQLAEYNVTEQFVAPKVKKLALHNENVHIDVNISDAEKNEENKKLEVSEEKEK